MSVFITIWKRINKKEKISKKFLKKVFTMDNNYYIIKTVKKIKQKITNS
ncbi:MULTISPECIES: hypothetical protein [Clostridium]|uniref:Uncharacterized protein n=1 Tax=Clostridium butyricum TaxID=1492 RepID=A0A6N3FZU5_CLOBU|nr:MULTISPECIES: hypothetical protein [Clostridium]MDB2161525.1 hypothetical protein [Clostridium butyricum]MDU6543412.1 hypothetical protein [Clostridium sp.]